MRDIRITAEEWSRGVRHCGNCDGHGFYGVWNGTDYDRTECIDCNQTGRTASRAAMEGDDADYYVIQRMGELLAKIALTVKGPYPGNGVWGYTDLPEQVAALADDRRAFKNFHRSLCERFGYTHDERDWRRDQVSLEEHIATHPRTDDE